MPAAEPDAAPVASSNPRRLQALIPFGVFMAPFGAAAALAAATHAKSPLLVALATAVLLATLAGFAAWVLITDRRASKARRHARMTEEDWAEFERSFWAHVERRSERP